VLGGGLVDGVFGWVFVVGFDGFVWRIVGMGNRQKTIGSFPCVFHFLFEAPAGLRALLT
jgi:hypothetical protein